MIAYKVPIEDMNPNIDKNNTVNEYNSFIVKALPSLRFND